MRFVCISGVTSTFLKMPPSIDMILFMLVPSEISLSIAVMKLELRAGVPCLSGKPANSQYRIVTVYLPSFWHEVYS